jgi:hypothetical protein
MGPDRVPVCGTAGRVHRSTRLHGGRRGLPPRPAGRNGVHGNNVRPPRPVGAPPGVYPLRQARHAGTGRPGKNRSEPMTTYLFTFRAPPTTHRPAPPSTPGPPGSRRWVRSVHEQVTLRMGFGWLLPDRWTQRRVRGPPTVHRESIVDDDHGRSSRVVGACGFSSGFGWGRSRVVR